jgi:ABC-type phosphate transport system permease subunit
LESKKYLIVCISFGFAQVTCFLGLVFKPHIHSTKVNQVSHFYSQVFQDETSELLSKQFGNIPLIIGTLGG